MAFVSCLLINVTVNCWLRAYSSVCVYIYIYVFVHLRCTLSNDCILLCMFFVKFVYIMLDSDAIHLHKPTAHINHLITKNVVVIRQSCNIY